MTNSNKQSPEGPSNALERIGDEIWIVEGEAVSFYGFPYPTRMAIVRLSHGDLWIWSPTGLTEGLRAEIDALGPVRHLVEPNKLHHLFLPAWASAYPEARVYAPPGLAKKRPDIAFDAELGDDPDAGWAGEIDQVVFRGSLFMDEVVFFHRQSKSTLVCDLIQKFDPQTMRGWRGLLMRLDGLVGPDGSTPREWRASFWNRRAGRGGLRKALGWDTERLVIAHGVWLRTNGREAMRRSLSWLKP
ncbi:MAG: DUF4336 domain-containing protein [Thermodesulfobacteriota bacterium]